MVDIATLGIAVDSRHVRQADRDLDRLTGSARSAERATAGLAGGFATAGAALKGFLGGALLGFGAGGLAALPGYLKRSVDEASKLVNVADRIGVSTRHLQELTHVASLADVEFGSLSQQLQFFSRQLGVAATGQGDLDKILRANGISLTDSQGRYRGVNAVLHDYADLLQRAESDSARLSLAQAAFGRGGLEMVTVLQGGSAALREQSAEAQRLGLVIGDDLLRRSEALGDEWTKFTRQLTVNFQEFVLSVANGVRLTISDLDRLRSALRDPTGAGASGTFVGGLLKPSQSGSTAPAVVPGLNTSASDLFRAWDAFDVDDGKRAATDQLRSLLGGGSASGAASNAGPMQLFDSATSSVSGFNDRLRESISLFSGFSAEVRAGGNVWQALGNRAVAALDQIADRLLNDVFGRALSSLFGGALGGGGGYATGLAGGMGVFMGGLYASGGLVRGPGTGTSDSVPARLSNGEYVVNARATAQYRDLLDVINGGAAFGFNSPMPIIKQNPFVYEGGFGGFGEVLA